MLNIEIQEKLASISKTECIEDSVVQILDNLSQKVKDDSSLTLIRNSEDAAQIRESSLLTKLTARIIDAYDMDYVGGVIKEKSTNLPQVFIFGDDSKLDEIYKSTKENLDWENPVLITRRLCKARFVETKSSEINLKNQDFMISLYSNHDDIRINQVYTFVGEYQLPASSTKIIEEKQEEDQQMQLANSMAKMPMLKTIYFEKTNLENYYGLIERKSFDKSSAKNLSETLLLALNSVVKDELISKLLLISLASSS